MSTITVPSGAGGTSVALSFATKASASLASLLLGSVYAAASKDSLSTYPVGSAAAAVNEYVISPYEFGTFTVPAGYNAVIDASLGPVTIVGNSDSNVSVVAGSSNFMYVSSGGSGTIVAGYATDTFSGSGAYALLGDAFYVSKTPTVSAPTVSAGGTVVAPTSPYTPVTTPVTTIVQPIVSVPVEIIEVYVSKVGFYTYGSGSGRYIITNDAMGPSTIAINAGASTVSALVDGGVYYENGGALTFVNNAASTVVGSASSGPQTIFGGNSNSAYFQGEAAAGWMFVNGSSNASITAGAAGGVLAFNGAFGTINLFGSSSSAFNYLVGGTGVDTLNAAGASGTAVVIAGAANTLAYLSNTSTDAFFAGSGSSTIIGGATTTSLPDLYAFANGSAGGTDVILNWGKNSGLVFLGYGAKDDALIAAELDSVPTTSSVASFKLPDNTIVTVVGMNGSAVNLSSNPMFLS
jgi:hypothetical protein